MLGEWGYYTFILIWFRMLQVAPFGRFYYEVDIFPNGAPRKFREWDAARRSGDLEPVSAFLAGGAMA